MTCVSKTLRRAAFNMIHTWVMTKMIAPTQSLSSSFTSSERADGSGSGSNSSASGVMETVLGVVVGVSGMTLQMMQGASMISFGPVYTSSGTLTSPGGSASSEVPPVSRMPVSRMSVPLMKPRSIDESLWRMAIPLWGAQVRK